MAQTVNDFLFPWEDAESAENPIGVDEDEGFSLIMHQNRPPQQPLQPGPALRSIDNLQNSTLL